MELDFERQEKWWDAMAPDEDKDQGDGGLNKLLRWREIEKHLPGVNSILDVGAGIGAFSIPLAERGFSLTHLDFSARMLALAEQKARGLGLKNISFIKRNAIDLSVFPDRSFDLVLNMDGAVTSCGVQAERALQETCRVARRKVIITVSNLGGLLPYWVMSSFSVFNSLIPAVFEFQEKGLWDQNQYPDNPALARFLTGGDLCQIKAFRAGELRGLFERLGMKILRLGGIGSLSYLCHLQMSAPSGQIPEAYQAFIEMCERFDLEIMPDGPGTQQRAGLIAVAEWPE